MEKEIMETVLHEILQELKSQKAKLDQLQTGIDAQSKTSGSIEQKLLEQDALSFTLAEDQLRSLRDLIKENFEALRAEIARNPSVCNTHKHISLVPLTFRMEHFPLFVNTVMRWVVVLIILIFAMWLIAGLVR
jgi:hypothetical protein